MRHTRKIIISRVLKKNHLLRYAYHASLRRTEKYASFFMIVRALPLAFFDHLISAGASPGYVRGAALSAVRDLIDG